MSSNALQPSLAESLCEVWAVLHKRADFHVLDSELHYLTSMAVTAHDDTVSHLLLKKLRLARPAQGETLPRSTVTMNSYIEFSFGESTDRRFCQLLHPTTAQMPTYGMSITSLVGAGLIALTAGQSILWPNEEGKLRDLHVIHAENCPGMESWLSRSP